MKQRKNYSLRTAGVLGLLVVLTICLLAGTIAKYTTEKNATGKARVAKFNVSAGEEEERITLNGLYDNWTDGLSFAEISQTTEDDVWSLLGDEADKGKPIAPGTSGVFQVNIKNDSEVTVNYELAFDMVDSQLADVPLEFTTKEDGTGWENLSNVVLTGQIDKDNQANEKALKIYWRWLFERGADDTLVANDKKDTELGLGDENGDTAEINLAAKIKFNQQD